VDEYVKDKARLTCVRCGHSRDTHMMGSHSVDGPLTLFCRDKGTSWTEFLSALDAQVCPLHVRITTRELGTAIIQTERGTGSFVRELLS